MLNAYLPIVQGGNVCKWADDSQRFILEYFDLICKSPSQIYCSALPLSPSSSWLHIYYTQELLQAPKVVRGAKIDWGACSRTVSLGSVRPSLSCWNTTVAVGCQSGKIIILSAITGSQVAVLSEHTSWAKSLTFSSNGRLLVSGSYDKTVKLWDMQTGGVIKTFHGHRRQVSSVSISMDCFRIISGSGDGTICLWDIQTGECLCTIQQESVIYCVNFSPLNPQHIFSISGGQIWEWDIDGHHIPSTYDGSWIIFSPDHAQFALYNGKDITIQDSYSKTIVAKIHVTDGTSHYCFSPDKRLIATADGKTAYVWDITTQDSHLVETFVSHVGYITSLVFSSASSLISASDEGPVEFWKIGTLSTDEVITNEQSTLHSPACIVSISLQARDGIAISSDVDGLVKTWDISTGICKASFKTPAVSDRWTTRDAKLIDNRLIFIWYIADKIHIWEAEKGELFQIAVTTLPRCLRISGDGSKIICLSDEIVQAWSVWTWEHTCEMKLDSWGTMYLDSLCTYSSRIWIHSLESLAQEGWDFGTSGSSPVPFDPSTGRPHLDFIGGARWQTRNPSWIKDTATKRRVFQLSGEYAVLNDVQWDGQFLVAGYDSGEVLILDFQSVLG